MTAPRAGGRQRPAGCGGDDREVHGGGRGEVAAAAAATTTGRCLLPVRDAADDVNHHFFGVCAPRTFCTFTT